LTCRANQRQHSIIAQFVKPPMALPISGANRGPVPTDIPDNVSLDYIEACNVLPISAKASAALSRRCLQTMLHAAGYKAKDLSKEIDLLLNETDTRKALPHKLRETVDAIRNFGNFSAHPIDDKTTLQVIKVEPHEAEKISIFAAFASGNFRAD
jgi:hypothetical protein